MRFYVKKRCVQSYTKYLLAISSSDLRGQLSHLSGGAVGSNCFRLDILKQNN